MAERFPHLRITRVERANDRRTRRGFGPRTPGDPRAHGTRLDQELAAHDTPPEGEIPGFDPNRLLKITLSGMRPDELNNLPGFSVVSQEGKEVTVLFADAGGVAECRRRLQQLGAGDQPIRKDILFAIQHVDEVTADDRTGPALRAEGPPRMERFVLDVELWPLDRSDQRERMIEHFELWCGSEGVSVLDKVSNSALILVRVEAGTRDLDALLRMRDVRQVDLPPRYDLAVGVLQADIAALPEISAPPANAPGVVVLDSGLATNHPLLGVAMGDEQDYTGYSTATAEGLEHGTFVGSFALYGDLEGALDEGTLSPEVHLFSGRIWDPGLDGEGDAVLLENRIAQAVAYFHSSYACRVFVLAFGDTRKVYRGAHVDRLAATLDMLAKQHGVLFVVSAGNFEGTDSVPRSWRTEFPRYLTTTDARIIDPATALNALTVGGLARREVSHQTRRFPHDPAHQPIARADQPSPFTRSGPGPLGAVKPELVEYAGNWYIDTRVTSSVPNRRELGEVGASSSFSTGRLFALNSGTSCAAPKVGNLAARLFGEYRDVSPDLVRALLVAHAAIPDAAAESFVADRDGRLQLLGYGKPRSEPSRYSTERCVTLIAEERIGPDQHHFFELPLPEDLFASGRRPRRITVALAHTPSVRRTRLEYKEAALEFRVVRAVSIEEVALAYRRLRKGERQDPIPENGFFPGPLKRAGGTLQCASRVHKVTAGLRRKPYFVVLTHRARDWAPAAGDEPYALAVVIEDYSGAEVRLYSQIRELLRVRARARV